MGTAISRCTTTRNNAGMTTNLTDIGQKILDNQPNWLSTPSKWRPRNCTHRPVRYRTPTPYPKDDRQRMPEPQASQVQTETTATEKPVVIETYATAPSTKHIQVVEPPKRSHHPLSNVSTLPDIQLPPAALSITFDRHPRRNRFERIS